MSLRNKITQFHETGFTYPNDMKPKTLGNTYLQNTRILKDKYLDDSQFDFSENLSYRIVSWNVRYWTNVNNEPSIEEIVDTVELLNPDIICLQEATLGSNTFYKSDPDLFTDQMRRLETNYKIISLCSVTPSWYSDFYGNMVLVKRKVYDQIMHDGDHVFNKYICNKADGRCAFNQQPRYFRDIPKTVDFSKNNSFFRHQASSNENKCYIRVSFPDFDLICTHLDAYTIDARIEQLKQINDAITRETIVIGDFNFFNYEEFEKSFSDKFKKDIVNFHEQRNNIVSKNREYNYLTKELKWKELKTDEQVKYSQWALTRVDHVFIVNQLSIKPIKLLYYPSGASDHLPLVFDFQPKNLLPVDTFSQQQRSDPLLISIEQRKWYNAQPIKAFDWILPDKSFNPKYINSDPFLTGNTGMALGNDGIYLARDMKDAITFGVSLNDIYSFNTIFSRILLMFTFNGIAVPDVPDENELPYLEKFDSTVPVICKEAGRVCKVTPQGFEGHRSKYIDIEKITIVSLYVFGMDISFTHSQSDELYAELNRWIERAFDKYPEIQEEDKFEIRKQWINVKNAVDYLEENMFLHPINFSWSKVRMEKQIDSDRYQVEFDIPIRTPGQTAGLLTQTYNKYQKYKLRYNSLKSTMR